MNDLEIEEQLEKVLDELNQTKGVEGSIIISSSGEVLKHTLRYSGEVALFGPMSQVIVSSSQRLLGSADLGQMEKVLLESKKGKSLFLQFEKVHLIILIEKNANLGMVMRASHRASPQIIDITRDLVVEEPVVEEITVPETVEEGKVPEVAVEITESMAEEEVVPEPEVTVEAEAASEPEVAEPIPKPTPEPELIEEPEVIPEPVEAKPEAPPIQFEDLKESPVKAEEPSVVEPEVEEKTAAIPSIRPPISLPTLPTEVQVPDDPEGRSYLILEIYESIFLSMTIGASKIMGVSPARGLTKQFLPSHEYKELLDGVDVKRNAAIDFDVVKKNADKIPVEEREAVFLKDFSQIIKVVTDNYGRVMGYDAFRGMVRPEFKAINASFGEAMAKLGINDKMHPELQKLL
ncbi:MAG: hypothetical protein BME94_04310 [Methanobacteriales archaeon Met13]